MWHKELNSTEPAPRLSLLCTVAGTGLAVCILWFLLRPMSSPPPPSAPVSLLDPLELPEPPPDTLHPESAGDLLVEAVVQIESGGNPDRVGSVGERGLMQIRESTWKQVTKRHFDRPPAFDRAFEPDLNRQVGRLYLGDLQEFLYDHRDRWQSDLRSLLLACYNAGPERVRAAGFDVSTLPESVRSYAKRGSALHDVLLRGDVHSLHQRLIEAGRPADSQE